MEYDVIIVGGGIAGLSAALYSARQKLKTLLITLNIGGQLLLAEKIENYPGIEEIEGIKLIENVKKQAEKWGVEFVFDEVIDIRKENDNFIVKTRSGEYKSMAVIIASGKKPKKLGVPGEDLKGVSYCAICDAPLFRNKIVMEYGIGYPAFEGAKLLSEYANKVIWAFPGDSPGVEEDLLKLIKLKKNVEIWPQTKIIEIIGDKNIEKIRIIEKGGEKEIYVDGLIIEMGYTTDISFLKNLGVKFNEKNEIIIDRHCRTNVEGVFACGDCTDNKFKQAIISAGQGAYAALMAFEYVMRKRGKEIKFFGDWRHEEKEKRVITFKL